MSLRASTDWLLCDVEINPGVEESCCTNSFDSCPERRRQIETRLLRKLDMRASFLLLVYLMNIVSFPSILVATSSRPFRSTEAT